MTTNKTIRVICTICGWHNAMPTPICPHLEQLLTDETPLVDILKRGLVPELGKKELRLLDEQFSLKNMWPHPNQLEPPE